MKFVIKTRSIMVVIIYSVNFFICARVFYHFFAAYFSHLTLTHVFLHALFMIVSGASTVTTAIAINQH
jgi:hypothetical protein